jgi:hypothetical protein
MPTAQLDIVSVISDLLAAQQGSGFHFLAEADPYINRAIAEVRQPLQEIIAAGTRQEGELAALIGELGSTPLPPAVTPEHQYLAFLTIEFLLPKLREDKLRSIARYDRALESIGATNEMATQILTSHLEEHRQDLATLDRAISHVKGQARASSTPRVHQ